MDSEFILTHYEQIHQAYQKMEWMFKTLGDEESGKAYKLTVKEEIPSSDKEAPKVIIYEGYRKSIESAFLSLSCAHDNLRSEIITYIEGSI